MRNENNTLAFTMSDNYGEPRFWYATGFYRRKLEPGDREQVESGVMGHIWDEVVHECNVPDLQYYGQPYVSLYDVLQVEITTDSDGVEWLEVEPL